MDAVELFRQNIDTIVAVVTGLVFIGTAAWKFQLFVVKKLREMLTAEIKAMVDPLNEKMDRILPVADSIQKEFNNNSGTSIRDLLENIRDDVTSIDARAQLLIDNEDTPVFTTDEHGGYLYGNQSWHKLTGLDSDAAKGNGWVIGIHPEDREKVWDNWLNCVKFELPFSYEYRFQNFQTNETSRAKVKAIPIIGSKKRLKGYHGVVHILA